MTLCEVNIQYSCKRKRGEREEREPYRVFEPGDPDHSHHDADDDGPEAEEGELSGGVALVPAAVRGVQLACRHGAGGGETVLPDNSEGQTGEAQYELLSPPPPTLVTGSSGRSGRQ